MLRQIAFFSFFWAKQKGLPFQGPSLLCSDFPKKNPIPAFESSEPRSNPQGAPIPRPAPPPSRHGDHDMGRHRARDGAQRSGGAFCSPVPAQNTGGGAPKYARGLVPAWPALLACLGTIVRAVLAPRAWPNGLLCSPMATLTAARPSSCRPDNMPRRHTGPRGASGTTRGCAGSVFSLDDPR